MRPALHLIVAALLFVLFVQRLRRILARRPILTVGNSRSLLFAGSLLTSCVYVLARL